MTCIVVHSMAVEGVVSCCPQLIFWVTSRTPAASEMACISVRIVPEMSRGLQNWRLMAACIGGKAHEADNLLRQGADIAAANTQVSVKPVYAVSLWLACNT